MSVLGKRARRPPDRFNPPSFAPKPRPAPASASASTSASSSSASASASSSSASASASTSASAAGRVFVRAKRSGGLLATFKKLFVAGKPKVWHNGKWTLCELKSAEMVTTNAKLKHAYEALAQKFEQKTVPMLDRSKAPAGPRQAQAPRHINAYVAAEEGIVTERLAFHGTPQMANITSICKKGFKQPTRRGTHGKAVYSSQSSDVAAQYANRSQFGQKSTNAVIGCRVLTFTKESFGHINAVIDPRRVLPVCVLRFQPKAKRRKTK